MSSTFFPVTSSRPSLTMTFMLPTLDVCRRIKMLAKERGIKRLLLALAIGKDRTTLENKLAGRTKFYYEEIVILADRLSAPELVADSHEWKPSLDPRMTVLSGVLKHLPDDVQDELWKRIQSDVTYYAERLKQQPPLAVRSRRKARSST